MGAEKSESSQSSGELLEQLIDRVAESVVEKLEERRKIDLIAQAVLQRIRLQAPFREAPAMAGDAPEPPEAKETES